MAANPVTTEGVRSAQPVIPPHLLSEEVLSVHHWTDTLFTFRCTRSATLRFEAGQFLMLGLMIGGAPLLRAYSMASAPWDEELEFLSIKVPDGPLTSVLQSIQPGDRILLKPKPVGSLMINNLEPQGTLWLWATGTGLAPFMSIIQSPETYERFERVVVCHTVRRVSELAYRSQILELPTHPVLGELITDKLVYYPSVTREPFPVQGRITNLIESGRIFEDLKRGPLDPAVDRVMLCGSESMNRDCIDLLEARGFTAGNNGERGTYLYERAFVTR
jgi:ferredoxin/flavodoxin---NADP+ reductase